MIHHIDYYDAFNTFLLVTVGSAFGLVSGLLLGSTLYLFLRLVRKAVGR